MIVTSTALAFVSPHSHISPTDLAKPESITGMVFVAEDAVDYWTKDGYTQVGTAQITVELLDRDQMVSNKIEALRSQAVNIRAEATAKVTKIEGQINQLLAIENGTAPQPAAARDDDDDFPF